jgi:hypothetical protein
MRALLSTFLFPLLVLGFVLYTIQSDAITHTSSHFIPLKRNPGVISNAMPNKTSHPLLAEH